MSADNTARLRGAWMQTYTGRQFYPTSPQPEDVDIEDIAHALSLICRYGGHVHRFYSVAEHCIHLSHAVEPEHALWALLHDATEAYVGDMVRPLKVQLPAYVEIEDRLMAVIAETFGLAGREIPDAVKDADTRILLDERAALMPNTQYPWQIEGLEPLGVEVFGWAPHVAEFAYLARFYELRAGAVGAGQPPHERPSVVSTATDVAPALRALADDSAALEVARRAIEDELIEWRDARRFVLRNNGFVVKERDGSDSCVIRFGPELGVRIALLSMADSLDKAAP